MYNMGENDKYYDYTEYSGANVGCTPVLTYIDTHDYNIRVYSEAKVGSSPNYIRVRNNDTDNNRYFEAVTGYSPTADGVEDIQVGGPDPEWNVLGAMAFSQYRRRGGLSGETYIAYVEDGGNHHTNGAIYIDDGYDRKYIILHELGHAVMYKAMINDGQSWLTCDWNYTQSDVCYTAASSSHRMDSIEWNCRAIKEGWAHFYPAVIWNKDSETDCWFEYWIVLNWDFSGGDDDPTISCDDEINTGIAPTYDWLDYYCTPSDWDNMGGEYDWLRFWWDMTARGDVYFTDCLAIVVGASPEDWIDHGHDTGTDYPSNELAISAYLEGFSTEWSDWTDEHHVDR